MNLQSMLEPKNHIQQYVDLYGRETNSVPGASKMNIFRTKFSFPKNSHATVQV